MFALIIKGIVIGFIVATPVGPIAILCIQRSLSSGFRIGLMTGFGAAIADGLFGLMAGLGFTAVFSQLMAHRILISAFGGLCLIGLGLKLMLTPFHESQVQSKETKNWHAFTTAFLLTLTNPLTILAFVAVFATFGLRTLNNFDAIFLSAGITLGSACWWLFLSSIVAFVLHHRLSSKALQWINRLAGAIFMLSGLGVLLLIKQSFSLI